MARDQDWLTQEDTDQLATLWPTALEEMGADELGPLLTSARAQCQAFAPALDPDANVPDEYLLAQVLQARALWRSMRANTSDGIGADGLTVAVYPMDWTVKSLLRPNTARPRVGRGRKKDT